MASRFETSDWMNTLLTEKTSAWGRFLRKYDGQSRIREPCQGDDGDVVILAERDGGFGGLGSISARSEQRLQPFEAENLAGGCARLEQTVGIKSAAVARMEVHDGFLIGDLRIDAQGQCARQVNLSIVEVGCWVAGTGQGTGPARIEAQDNAGREAALKTAMEAAAEAGKNFGRTGSSFCERAHCTHDE